jgi:hypothetical protein
MNLLRGIDSSPIWSRTAPCCLNPAAPAAAGRREGYAIKRLGMFTEQEAQSVAGALSDKSIESRGGFTVAKLFVGTTERSRPRSWLYLSLEDATNFICQRMEKYADRKAPDRMFFDGDLIQFLAWRGGRTKKGRRPSFDLGRSPRW